MAEAESENEIVLKQMKNSPFSGEAGVALNAFLEGLSAFGAEFSRVADTLIQFFQATKLFLQAIKNPLTEALIATIDSLIEALEEMQSLGFGSVTVWPWEHGTYPSQLQTDKLDESIVALAAAMKGIDVNSLKISERGTFVETRNGETLLTPDQVIERGTDGYPFQTKDVVYDTMLGIRNFFHPEMWSGSTTPFYADSEQAAAGRKLAKEVALRQGSFEAAKGLSTAGDQSLTGQALDVARDSLHSSIKFTQKNLFVRELPPEECVRKIIESLSGSSPDSNKPTGSGPYKAFMLLFALPSINGVIQIAQSFADYFGDIIGEELVDFMRKNSPGVFDERVLTISLGEPLSKGFDDDPKKHSEWFFEGGDFKPTIGLDDGKYKVGGKINMFRPGDLLVQEGGVLGFNSFSAEVIEHYPIVIKKGMILDNRVKVKGARGEFIKTNQKSINSATIPIVRAITKEPISPSKHVIFRTDTLEKPDERTEGQFWGTIVSADNLITDIIPNNITGQLIRKTCQNSEASDEFGQFDKGLNTLLGGDDSENIVSSYMNFLAGVKKGMRTTHSFLKPLEFSDEFSKSSWFTGGKMQFNYGKMLDALPGLGVNYYVANIKINGVPIENMSSLTKEKVFVYPTPEEVGTTLSRPTAMNKLDFELGFLNHDGSFDTEFLNIFDISKFIDPPNGVVYSWQTTIPAEDPKGPQPPNQPFVLYSANKNVSPNWKYVRISDLFPAYGSTIQEAIGQIKKFKKQVEDISKSIDQYIKFLERQIKAIQRLNDQIQQLIAFFSQGLNAAGLYTAQFSGDGVAEFKKQLSTLKLVQTAKNKVHEISLETVESETVIQDPYTGLDKKVKRKVLRPSIQDQEIEPDGIPKALSELNNLKYSGAVVFFAQGPDVSKFDTFMNNFNGLATLGKGLLANLFNREDSIAQKIAPYVYEIQGQDKDGNWTEIERLAKIDDDGTIRIIFTNDANELKKSDREAINKQMEKTVNFSPKIQTGGLVFTGDPTENDAIVLYQGTFGDIAGKIRPGFSADTSYFQFSQQPTTSLEASPPADDRGVFEKEFFNLDLKTKVPMLRPEGETTYKILVQTSIRNFEGQPIKERKNLNIGFGINPVTVEFGELI